MLEFVRTTVQIYCKTEIDEMTQERLKAFAANDIEKYRELCTYTLILSSKMS